MKVRKSAMVAVFGLSVPAAFAAHQVSLPASLMDAGTQVVDVHVGLSYSEGPAVDPAGNLFFSEDPDVNTGRIWKITPSGEKSVFKDPSRGSNGLEFDNQGRLHIAMLDSVLRVETNGQVTVLAAKGTLNLARVNDLSISSTGTLFFTNLNGNTLFFRNASGQITTRTANGVNGVEWIEEKNIVYYGGNNLQKCQVDNATGVLSNCAQFAGATDGLTVDVQGNVWRANWSEGKIYAHDSTGQQLGSITIDAPYPAPSGKRASQGAMGNASNCHHGGPDLKTLYITGDGGLYSIKLKVAGRRRPNWPTSIGSGEFRLGKPPAVQPQLLRVNGVMTLNTGNGIVDAGGRFLPVTGFRKAQTPDR
jgi:gluconolactonase